MKIIAYAVRPDEIPFFEHFARTLNLDVDLLTQPLNKETVTLAQGYDAVCCFGICNVNKAVLECLKTYDIPYLASRSAGINNIDTKAAKELGIRFSNATYSPHSVADFTVMLILMSLRKMKTMIHRNAAHDFSLPGHQGKEIHNLTIGIIGTGRIGATTARSLSGFGCTLLGYDLYPNQALDTLLTYTDLDTLLEKADVITLHAPLLDSTYHLLNDKTLAQTKKGVIIINCARSELIDTKSLIRFIDSGHIGGCALDVFDHEVGIVHTDNRFNRVVNHDLAILNHYKDVIITPHIAFYTDQAVSDMVEIPLRSLKSFLESNQSQWEVTS